MTDYVRRHHADCEIHVISREKHHFYNRIGISRLIYGRSAMSGLYLQPEAWYDQHRVTCWLNTDVTHINRGHKRLVLATGETLPYDRLIIASGSASYVPPIAGYGLPGTFTLRDADDAMRLSARGYHRVLRVARTLADLDGAEKVGRVHLAEALSYRALVDEVRRAA